MLIFFSNLCKHSGNGFHKMPDNSVFNTCRHFHSPLWCLTHCDQLKTVSVYIGFCYKCTNQIFKKV